MKTKILIAALSIGLLTVSTVKAQEKAKMKVEQTEKVAYACPMQCEGEKTYDKAGSCPICKMDLKKMASKKDSIKMTMDHSKTGMMKMEMKNDSMKTSMAYACPMHAAIKSDKPGACPKCGMDLKKMDDKEKDPHKRHRHQ